GCRDFGAFVGTALPFPRRDAPPHAGGKLGVARRGAFGGDAALIVLLAAGRRARPALGKLDLGGERDGARRASRDRRQTSGEHRQYEELANHLWASCPASRRLKLVSDEYSLNRTTTRAEISKGIIRENVVDVPSPRSGIALEQIVGRRAAARRGFL